MFEYWHANTESVFKKLNSNIEGLSSEEANKRIEIYGKNEYKKPKKESLVNKIFSQFKDISMIILFVAGIISFIMAFNSGKNFIEPVIIFGIVVVLSAVVFCTVVSTIVVGSLIVRLGVVGGGFCGGVVAIVLRTGVRHREPHETGVRGMDIRRPCACATEV